MTLGNDLEGRAAVVTGASGELGRVIARTLGRARRGGAALLPGGGPGCGPGRGAAIGRPRDAMTVHADVTSPRSVEAMRDAVTAELGTADVIVANAVVQYRWLPVLEQPIEDFGSQFASCVLHSVHMVKAFAPGMIALGRGRVIGINTECAMQCFETQAAYAAGKRGMDGLYRVLARELGPSGITVNQVAPGCPLLLLARSLALIAAVTTGGVVAVERFFGSGSAHRQKDLLGVHALR